MLKAQKSGRAQIRSKNKVRIFTHLIGTDGVSRTQLEKALQLSAPSVTRITEELIAENLIYEAGTDPTPFGRKPTLLKVVEDAFYLIGVRLQRTAMYMCATNIAGDELYTKKYDLQNIENTKQLEDIFLLGLKELKTQTAINNEQILGVGVAARGVVNAKLGIVLRFSHNIMDVNLADIIENEIGCYWYIENNIIADVESEYIYGSHLMPTNFLYIFAEEGVGACLVNDGKIISGSQYLSGRLAHMVVEPNGKLCSCGKKGHLESYIIQSALENEYAEKTGEKLNFEQIGLLSQQGDKIACKILQNAILHLGSVILDMVLLLNPAKIVLQGAIFDLYEPSKQYLENYIKTNVFLPSLSEIDWEVRERKSFKTERLITKTVIAKALEEKM